MDDARREPRILITRLSALGDCVLTLPMVCALRDHFPNAFVAWAVEPLSASLLQAHRAVDQVIVVPKGWMKSAHTVRVLRTRLRELHFECVLDAQSLTKSATLGWLSGAPRRIGFARPQGRELAPWLNTEHVPRDGTHIVDASLRLLAPLGIVDSTIRFDFPSDRPSDARVERFLQSAHFGYGFAVINTGATWQSKRWMPERFGRVARFLGETHNLPTVITWSGDQEAEWAEQIRTRSGGYALRSPSLTVLELAALLRRARMVIASDTGPLHLATAVGTSCIGLYGPTRFERSGPYGSGHITLQIDAPIHRNRRRRRQDDTALRMLTVDTVCQACDDLLQLLDSSGRSNSASHAA